MGSGSCFIPATSPKDLQPEETFCFKPSLSGWASTLSQCSGTHSSQEETTGHSVSQDYRLKERSFEKQMTAGTFQSPPCISEALCLLEIFCGLFSMKDSDHVFLLSHPRKSGMGSGLLQGHPVSKMTSEPLSLTLSPSLGTLSLLTEVSLL